MKKFVLTLVLLGFGQVAAVLAADDVKWSFGTPKKDSDGWVFKEKTKKPLVKDTFVGQDGFTYEKRADGYYVKVEGKSAAPEVAAKPNFRSGQYNPDHRCPNPTCRYESPPRQGTWVVTSSNSDGTHNHTCPKCGTSWRH